MSIISFIFDKKKVHQAVFLLPLLTLYLTNQPKWLFFIALIILAIMEVYKIDLENKINILINNRVKQISKKKPLFRDWRDQIKDVKNEFNYIYALPFFVFMSIIFILEFIYSTYISYFYSWFLFVFHIFLIAYLSFLELVINNNFRLLAKNKNKFKKK